MSRYNDESDQNDLHGIIEVREGHHPSIYDKSLIHAEPKCCTCQTPAPIDLDYGGVECAGCHRPILRLR